MRFMVRVSLRDKLLPVSCQPAIPSGLQTVATRGRQHCGPCLHTWKLPNAIMTTISPASSDAARALQSRAGAAMQVLEGAMDAGADDIQDIRDEDGTIIGFKVSKFPFSLGHPLGHLLLELCG